MFFGSRGPGDLDPYSRKYATAYTRIIGTDNILLYTNIRMLTNILPISILCIKLMFYTQNQERTMPRIQITHSRSFLIMYYPEAPLSYRFFRKK